MIAQALLETTEVLHVFTPNWPGAGNVKSLRQFRLEQLKHHSPIGYSIRSRHYRLLTKIPIDLRISQPSSSHLVSRIMVRSNCRSEPFRNNQIDVFRTSAAF